MGVQDQKRSGIKPAESLLIKLGNANIQTQADRQL
jgi:hypothetical protein